MGESVHPGIGKEGDRKEKGYSIGSKDKERKIDNVRKFEEQRDKTYGNDQEIKSRDNIAQDAMLNQRKVSEEPWGEDDPETEKANIIHEELYVHGKVCIVDDRTVICGSANINDRVSLSCRMAILLRSSKCDGQLTQSTFF